MKKSMLAAWNKRSPREQLIAAATALVLGLALLQQLLWVPYQNFQDTLDRRLQAKAIQLAKADAQQRSGAAAKKASIADPSLAGLLREIETIAGQAKVRLLDVKPVTREDRGVENAQAVELELRPTFEALVTFLYELQASPRRMRVEALTLLNEGTRVTLTVAEWVPAQARRRPA
jgi:type II secretory pathway component PulM